MPPSPSQANDIREKKMTEAAALQIERLTLPTKEYERLTYPRFRELLSGGETAGKLPKVLAVGATLAGQPVGLALLSSIYAEDKRRLWSIAVDKSRRRQGIGGQLLTACETLGSDGGARRLVAYYSDQMPNSVAFERLISSAGWSPPDPVEYRLAGRASWVFDGQREWQFLLRRLERNGYSATSWADRSDVDRALVEKLASDETVCPSHLNPSRFDASAEPSVSIAIRRGGNVVGWVIGERSQISQEEIIHYTCGWVVPKLSRSGWLIAGVMEVCRRQSETVGPDSLAIFETRPDNLAMRKFMWERLKPRNPVWTDTRYCSAKEIGQRSTR